MATTSNAVKTDQGLIKGLGLMDSTTLVVGSMIGSGIFIVSADIARQVNSPGLLLMTWVATAALTLIAALSYGELAAAMPHAGGQYVYLREAFGPLSGFLFGWTLFLVIQTGTIAAVAVGFAKFAGVFVPWISAQNHLIGSGQVGADHAAACGRRDRGVAERGEHARHPHGRRGAERVHVCQDRRAAGPGRYRVSAGAQPGSAGAQFGTRGAISGTARAGACTWCGWWAWPWWGRCFRPTPGTTSRSRRVRYAIRGATCRFRSRWAWPS